MKVEKIITKMQDLDIIGAALLSVKEAEKLSLKLRDYVRWWWLRSPGISRDHAVLVRSGGHVYSYGDYVDCGINVAVRPALRIKNLSSSNFKVGDVFAFGGKRFEVVDDETAFCLEDIGTHAFRKDWNAADANDYENSDVKKFVDDWFDKVRNNND